MKLGHPHYNSIPCPSCGKTKSIDMDMENAYFKCVMCGASPINPYSSIRIETEQQEQPELISQAEIDFLEYLLKEGRL